MRKRFASDGPYKFREKGIFKSKKRAYAFAAKLRAQGKKVKVQHIESPCYGGALICGWCWSVRIWTRREPYGRGYTVDARRI